MPGLTAVAVPEWTGPLGLEPTPEMYIWHLLLCFAECRRVLREDGVMWVVMGDSFSQDGTPGKRVSGDHPRDCECAYCRLTYQHRRVPSDLQQGDLVGIPARLQFALQANGWIIRNDAVFSKKNCMPESVSGWRWERHRIKTGWVEAESGELGGALIWGECPGCDKCADNDGYVLRRGSWRHTRAHETIIMATKQMGYYANQEAVRERHARLWNPNTLGGSLSSNTNRNEQAGRNDGTRKFTPTPNPAGRNPRSVLTVASEPLHMDHYAAFPTALIAPLIRATCPQQCCPVCGAGWSPVVERETVEPPYRKGNTPETTHAYWGESDSRTLSMIQRTRILDCRPTCSCGRDDWVPGIVLDNFLGSGTTLSVCRDLGVRGVGLDLSHSYLDDQAKVRASVGAPSNALAGLPLFADRAR